MRRPWLIGLGAGMIGMVLVLIAWHLWLDHQALHQMIGFINASLAQPKAPVK